MAVLRGKLHVPLPRRRLVTRTRLTDRLVTGPGVRPRLVLVAAPAGFGKTTLLIQWLSAGSARVAWLSLDAGDADVRRFLSHLVAAVNVADPSLGADATALLESDRTSRAEDVLASLVDDLDTLSGPTVLALDDYHVVDATEVHEAVTFLLDNLPPQVTLAITTRADPPLPLARLRARGELLEVRADDLRFTEAEATAFLNEVMGLELEAHHVAALEHRTEGWATGLQLAALSAQRASELDGFVEAFAGSHRFVLDYLVEEVLEGQPEDVRTFLLDTSVLDDLTGPLCDAVTGRVRRPAAARAARAGEPLRRPARRPAAVVALPPPLRRGLARATRRRRTPSGSAQPAPDGRRLVRRAGPPARRRTTRAGRRRRRPGRRPGGARRARHAPAAGGPDDARVAPGAAGGRRTTPPAAGDAPRVGVPLRGRPRGTRPLARCRRGCPRVTGRASAVDGYAGQREGGPRPGPGEPPGHGRGLPGDPRPVPWRREPGPSPTRGVPATWPGTTTTSSSAPRRATSGWPRGPPGTWRLPPTPSVRPWPTSGPRATSPTGWG